MSCCTQDTSGAIPENCEGRVAFRDIKFEYPVRPEGM